MKKGDFARERKRRVEMRIPSEKQSWAAIDLPKWDRLFAELKRRIEEGKRGG